MLHHLQDILIMTCFIYIQDHINILSITHPIIIIDIHHIDLIILNQEFIQNQKQIIQTHPLESFDKKLR
jgi:hypothetical protein